MAVNDILSACTHPQAPYVDLDFFPFLDRYQESRRRYRIRKRHADLASPLLDILQKDIPERAKIIAMDQYLKAGVDVDAINAATVLAVKLGNFEVVRWLISERGAQINHRSSENWTILALACAYGDRDILQWLVHKGATLDQKVLNIAASRDKLEILKWLVQKYGGNINEASDDGWTVLASAVSAGKADVTRWLVQERGADVNSRLGDGDTILHLAVRAGELDVVKMLVQSGADVTAKDRYGRAPGDLDGGEIAEFLRDTLGTDHYDGISADLAVDHSGKDKAKWTDAQFRDNYFSSHYVNVHEDEFGGLDKEERGDTHGYRVWDQKRSKRDEGVFQTLQDREYLLKTYKRKNVILVMGNSGVGKTTFSQYITENYYKLHSVKNNETDEFIIEEERDFIPLMPLHELLTDDETNMAFYDCPGFTNSREMVYDISSAYYMKSLMDYATSVKLLFLVNYSSVKPRGDADDLLKLLKNASNFVKDFDKLQDSIALIVTKVENIYKDNILISDKVMVDNIAHSLGKLRATWVNDPKNEMFDQKARKLLQIFLSRTIENRPKIGLFRRPDKLGRFSDISLLQERKPALKNLIGEHLDFAPKPAEGFGYFLTDDAKSKIPNLLEELNRYITYIIKGIVDNITYTYQHGPLGFFHDPLYLFEFHEKAKRGNKAFTKLTRETGVSRLTPKELTNKFILALHAIEIDFSESTLWSYVDYLEFLEVFADETLHPQLSDWLTVLTPAANALQVADSCYDFLISLRERLFEYDVQKDRYKHGKDDVGHWGQRDVLLSKDNWQQFFTNMAPYLPKVLYDKVKALTPEELTGHYMRDVRRFIHQPLRHSVISKCAEPDRLVVEGDYILLSEISRNKCPEGVKFLDIFASNTVYIDQDIRRTGDKLSIFIIAPTWNIIGNREIVLDGAEGVPHQKKKADNAASSEERGTDGSPGLPGGPAGNFIGVGDVFKGVLTISANGGKGGPGQDGGDGGAGRRGSDPKLPFDGYDTWSISPLYHDVPDGTEVFKQKGYRHIRLNSSSEEEFTWYLGSKNTYHSYYIVYGEKGRPGGPGGDGGKGGTGGNAGVIKIIETGAKSNVTISNNPGKEGESGVGGEGGTEGCDGNIMVVHHHITIEVNFVPVGGLIYDLIPHDLAKWKLLCRTTSSSCYKGPSGASGINTVDIKTPDGALEFENIGYSFNAYKASVRANDYIYEAKRGTKFVEKVDVQVQNVYDTLAYIKEFDDLESELGWRAITDQLPMYVSLLNRISIYREHLNRERISKNDAMALDYLYAAVLAKVRNFKYDIEGTVDINMHSYVNGAVRNVKALEAASNMEGLSKAMQQNNLNYADSILGYIEEMSSLISDYINPDITVSFGLIRQKIISLENEIKYLGRNTEAEQRYLSKRQRELDKTVIVSSAFAVVSNLTKFIQEPLKSINSNGTISANIVGLYFQNYTNIDWIEEVVRVEQAVLGKYNGSIAYTLLPILKSMQEDLKTLKNSSGAGTQVIMERVQLLARNSVENINLKLHEFAEELHPLNQFVRSIEILQETTSIITYIYERLLSVLERNRFADSIANLSALPTNTIEDAKLKKNAANLESIIKSNVILKPLVEALNVYKQSEFPFAKFCEERISLLREDYSNSTAEKVIQNLEKMETLLDDNHFYDTFQYLFTSSSESGYTVVSPFFVWRNGKFRPEISKLLSGQPVTLMADVLETSEKQSAVKILYIEMDLTSPDPRVQEELKQRLEGVTVKMTHMGNSYSRADKYFYLIMSDTITIGHSLLRNKHGEPDTINGVYAALKNRKKSLLSPYAMWTVTLYNDTRDGINLTEYSDKIDLQLVGKGTYFHTNGMYMCIELGKDYKKSNLTSQINLIGENSGPKYGRSVRAAEDLTVKSGASVMSSPINKLIKWISERITFEKWLPYNGEERLHASREKFLLSDCNPIEFYNQVDCGLILAPIFLHLWNKLFKRKSQNRTSTNETLEKEVPPGTENFWRGLLLDGQKLMEILQKAVGSRHSEVLWYKDVLEVRGREIDELHRKSEYSIREIDEIEKNLFVFYVDLQDEVDYNKSFAKVKQDRLFSRLMKEALNKIREKSDFNARMKCFPKKSLAYDDVPLENMVDCHAVSLWRKKPLSISTWELEFIQQDVGRNFHRTSF